jgi:formylglycine-generating enzyme required for sulfatase activity
MNKFLSIIAFSLLLSSICWAGGNTDKTATPQKQQQPVPAQQQPQQRQPTTAQPQTQQTQTLPAQSQVQQPQPLPQPPASPYFTGDGGKGMSLGIRVPDSQGLNAEQAYIPAMVQGVLVANISKYSAISVLDRISLDKVIAETLDPTYEDSWDIVSLGHVAHVGHWMTGKIIKTSTGYTLQLNVTDTTPEARTLAAYSGTCTVAELDNQTAIQKASLELLTQMEVQLSERAKNELGTVNSQQAISAQTALARGITAERQGTEVAALNYYFQALAFDPALPEAVNRSSILAANISSGNIGADARNDIQWRRDWIARLTETEQFFNSYFDNFFKTLPPFPYTLLYTTDIRQVGEINYRDETLTLGIEAVLRYSPDWSQSVELVLRSMQFSVEAVLNGLNATGRKAVWGLDKWPEQATFNIQRFGERKQTFSITVELVNSRNQVIGNQTFQAEGKYTLSVPLPEKGSQKVATFDSKVNIIHFTNVKADNITDNLTIRFANVNGASAETASRTGVLQILAVSQTEFEKYRFGIFIRGGTFTMGSPSFEIDRKKDEIQHPVTVASFYMGKYEVTQKEYKDLMRVNYILYEGDNLPMSAVTFLEAIEYCNRLSQREGLTPAYTVKGYEVAWDRTANGYRLPTEAEWEYACRAGSITPFNTGNNITTNQANYNGNYPYNNNAKGTYRRRPIEVGSFSPNSWGLYDMHGNVAEMCWDIYVDGAPGINRSWPSTFHTYNDLLVVRGGGFNSKADLVRSASRGTLYLNNISWMTEVGFRIVRNY